MDIRHAHNDPCNQKVNEHEESQGMLEFLVGLEIVQPFLEEGEERGFSIRLMMRNEVEVKGQGDNNNESF